MRSAYAAVVVAAAALAAGCSDRSAEEPPPPSAPTVRAVVAPPPAGAGYSESLSELCTRTHAAHDAVGIATSPDELARKLPRTIAIDRRFVGELGRIVAPPPLRLQAGRLLQLFGAVSQNEDAALLHLRAGNYNGYFQYMDTALAVRLETDRLVTILAAPACLFRPFRGR